MKSINLFWFLLAAATAQSQSQNCVVDKPAEEVNALAANAGYTIADGCSSEPIQQAIRNGMCKATSQIGRALRANCCKSCVDHHYPLPETKLPSVGSNGEPVKLYLQAGQSECTGAASVQLFLDHHEATGEYSDLVAEQEGVYFAGYNKYPFKPNPDRFFISTMEVGKEKSSFGPEVAIGRRLWDASQSGNDIMIVKYCWGGSNVRSEWNPESEANSWNGANDDKSSEYLLEEGAAVLDSKDNLYGNLIYTARRTIEALDEADIDYEWAGMFWIQGNADSKSSWEVYGNDLKRLFTSVREDLGVPDLPIIDTGAGSNHGLNTAKIYGASTITNCNVKVPKAGFAVTDPDSGCIQGPSNWCPMFMNFDAWLYYGLDPGMMSPPFSDDLDIPEGYNKTMAWFKDFPTNQHSEYDGAVWKGRMLANDFIRTFTDWTLTEEMTADDPLLLFPAQSCGRPDDPDYTPPAEDNVCFIDMRGADAMDEISCDVETGEFL